MKALPRCVAEARQSAGHMAIDAVLHADLRRMAGTAAPAYKSAQPWPSQHSHAAAAARQPVTNAVAARMMHTPGPPPVARVALTVSNRSTPACTGPELRSSVGGTEVVSKVRTEVEDATDARDIHPDNGPKCTWRVDQEDEQAAGFGDARGTGAGQPKGLGIGTRILHPSHKSVEDPYFAMAPPLYQAGLSRLDASLDPYQAPPILTGDAWDQRIPCVVMHQWCM